MGYRQVERPVYVETTLPVEGTLPPDLQGTFFRNGPAQHEVGAMRYHHWFDGDGMIHAYRFDGQSVTHRARMIETEKYCREQEAGRALITGFGTVVPGSEGLAASADSQNVANINVLQHNGELLALWEGGSAYQLDPETLETLGLKTWNAQTAGAPFSAHPRIDTDGTLWNFGYAAPFGAIILYRIAADGRVLDTGVIPAPETPMVHDFVITARYLVLILAPFRFEQAREGAFIDKFAWRGDEVGRALVIDKNNLSAMQEIETPPMWIFHYANAHEDAAGRIIMQAPVYDTPSVMTEAFREVMRGNEIKSAPPRFMLLTLDPAKGRFDAQEINGLANSEFPRIDQSMQGQRHRYSYAVQSSRGYAGRGFDRVNLIDHETGQVQGFQYSASEMAEEHLFVRRPGATKEGDGWLLGTSLDVAKGHSMLNVFRADAPMDGPIARMPLPYALPLGLHGNFYT
ncbi:MAG: carotenoid oxygenase family protein [Rhodobacteraceae bacterium]|nr:carotenoid oxygenase family protein [Paracoccaceae bacterium]